MFEIITIIGNMTKTVRKSTGSNFEPSMKILSRIMQVMLEKNSVGRTALSQEANINYTILLKYIGWLKDNSLTELIINEDGKVNLQLSINGKEFALQLSNLTNGQIIN